MKKKVLTEYNDILELLKERPHQTASQLAAALAKNSADWDNQFNRVWAAKAAGLIRWDFTDKRFTLWPEEG